MPRPRLRFLTAIALTTAVALPARAQSVVGKEQTGKALDTFAAAMAAADGKVLLRCTVAWRASHLWAAYLIRDRATPVATALAHARLINLMDDRPIGGGQQPLEGFLGRVVPEMGHPKP